MTQNELIMKHLRKGKTLTRLEAFFLYRIQNITARITELKGQGHEIETEVRRDEAGHRYARYSLAA